LIRERERVGGAVIRIRIRIKIKTISEMGDRIWDMGRRSGLGGRIRMKIKKIRISDFGKRKAKSENCDEALTLAAPEARRLV